MDTEIFKTTEDGKRYNKLGQEVISCKICGENTTMLGTSKCDRCFDLDNLIGLDPDIAEKLLKAHRRKTKIAEAFNKFRIFLRKFRSDSSVAVPNILNNVFITEVGTDSSGSVFIGGWVSFDEWIYLHMILELDGAERKYVNGDLT